MLRIDSWRNLLQGSNNVSIEKLWTSAEVGSNKIHKQGELTSTHVGNPQESAIWRTVEQNRER